MTTSLLLRDHRKHLKALRAETEARITRAETDIEELLEVGTDVGASEDDGGAENDASGAELDRLRVLVVQETQVLAEIDEAEARITAKTWRKCSRCTKPIGPARLDALPTTKVCVSCKVAGDSWS